MKAVKIQDIEPGRNCLAVDLRHVLRALGPRAIASDWRVYGVWAEGEAKPSLERLNENQILSGRSLQDLADQVHQVIDGEFTAFDPAATIPWVKIEAVDSTYYVVNSDDASVLETIRGSFKKVSSYPVPGQR